MRGWVVCGWCGLVVEFAVDAGPEWRAAERRSAPLKAAGATGISAKPGRGVMAYACQV